MDCSHSSTRDSATATSPPTTPAPNSSVVSRKGDSDAEDSNTSSLPISQFKTKRRTSKIWDHTSFGRNEIIRNKDGQIIWRCKHCKGNPAEYLETGGTAHIYKHLKSHSGLGILTPNEERTVKTRNRLEEAFSRMSPSTASLKRRRHDDEPTELDADRFEQLYVEWIADCGVALRMATRETFRALLNFLNPGVLSILPTSHPTIRGWVMRTFDTQKRRMRQVLQSALSRIHFTVDVWSSPNKLGILGIVAHFIDSNGELVSYCVALREIHGKHSGDNQARLVMDVIEDYGIVTQVGYFVSDNADSNDTLMDALQILLHDRHHITYDAKHHRLRCTGHTINLAAHAFMFPKAAPVEAPVKNKVQKDTTSEYVKPSESDILKWRKAGPLGKLHNIVVFIRCSPQRIQRFKEISEKKGLLRDNDTRWNSKYYMTARAIEVADQIDYFCSKEKDLKLDSLSEQDWTELKKVCNFLKSFADATKATEGHAHTIDRTLPIMDFLLSKFEAARIEYGSDAFMAPCVEAGWAKLDAYYTLTDRSSAYVAAIVLSPHRKWHYFDVAWEDHPEWVESSKAAVEALWKTRYGPVTKPAESQAHALVDKPPVKNSFLAWEDEREDLELPTQFDEYQNYISAPRIKVKDVRKWWLEDTQQMLYPNLSKMALDLLSIPAMSAEPERLFSDTKITLQDRRNRLGIGVIEAIECIKSWSRSHKVAWVDDVGLTLDTSVTGEEERAAVLQFDELENAFNENVDEQVSVSLLRNGELVLGIIDVVNLYKVTPKRVVSFAGLFCHDISYVQAVNASVAASGVYVAGSEGPLMIGDGGPGWVIHSLNGQAIRSLEEFLDQLMVFHKGQSVVVTYARLESLYRCSDSVITLYAPAGFAVFSEDEATGLWRSATMHLRPLPPPSTRIDYVNKISPHAQCPAMITNLIHVESRAYLSLDGYPATLARGMGVVVDAGAGLVVVSRKVVPHKACFVRVTLGSTAEVAARCVFLHAHHCYAIIQYDVSSAPSGVEGVTLGDRRPHSGSEASLVYFGGPEQLLRGDAVQRSVVLTRSAPRPSTPTFKCQPVNADLLGIEVPSEVQGADGVVVSSDGSVQAIWMPGIGGLAAASLSKVLSRFARDSIPDLHVMPAEMEVISMRQARIMDVPEDFLRSVAESTCTSSIFMVKRTFTTQLKEGDVVLALDNALPACWADFEVSEPRTIPVQLWRQGAAQDLGLKSIRVDDLETTRCVEFCGAYVQPTPLAVRHWLSPDQAHDGRDVYITDVRAGSTAALYSLPRKTFVTKLNGEVLRDFDAFVAAAKGLSDDRVFTMTTVTLNGRENVCVLQSNEGHHPFAEWTFDGAEFINKTMYPS